MRKLKNIQYEELQDHIKDYYNNVSLRFAKAWGLSCSSLRRKTESNNRTLVIMLDDKPTLVRVIKTQGVDKNG